MVGEPEGYRHLVEKVSVIYSWIDSQIEQDPGRAGRCKACGACCDFPAYDHRLFVTPPELMYLAAKLGERELRPMTTGRCPYQQGPTCTVHKHRFTGCRIFCCAADPDLQSELSEGALRRLKGLCEEFGFQYRYQDLATALGTFNCDTYRSAGGPCPEERAG